MEQWYKNEVVFNSYQAIRMNETDKSLPAVLTDETILGLGYIKVVRTDAPVITAIQICYENGVEVMVDGTVQTKWVVADMFSDTLEHTSIDGAIVPAKTKLQHETEHLAKLQADAIASMVQHFTAVTTAYIEGKVTAYNQANGLAFANIDAFTKYAINPLSQHYAIANQFINYADSVWKAVRDYQATATTAPSDAEFNAILDAVAF